MSASGTVLVAEDDLRLAALLEQALSEAGWAVQVVHDGRSAYAHALDGGYDVLLLDRMLPGQDGLAACGRLREVGLTTPVLMLTARSEVRDRTSGLDAGADDDLAKPFDLDELLARLRLCAGGRQVGHGPRASVECAHPAGMTASGVLPAAVG